MELAASSLTALRHSAPASVVLPPFLDVSVTPSCSSTCLVLSPLAPVSLSPIGVVSSPAVSASVGVISPSVVSPVGARITHKVARKARSVTHFVLPDDTTLGAGSVPVSSTSEAAGSSMPPLIP
jgi:hypothetical protein